MHRLSLALVLTILVTASFAETAPDGMAAYREGNCKPAIESLQAAAAANPKDATVRAALLSCLVYEGRVDDARDAFQSDADDFPDTEEIMVARAEFLYYMGDMFAAEKLYRNVLKKNDSNARAAYGMFRLYQASSQYRAARLMILRAHEIDPADALITRAWLGFVTPQKRDELLPPFAAAHPWLYKRFEQQTNTQTELKQETNGRKFFELDGEPQETTFHLITLLNGPNQQYGLGISLTIEGGKRLTMLFDTGASGILMNQRAIDKIGLSHLGSLQVHGIGDKGPRNGFLSVADTCQAGDVRFKTCLITVLEGKRSIGEEDGLIGADLFSAYLIEIDFQSKLLHLTPQPSRPPNPQGYNRDPLMDPPGFTSLFRYGHHLLVSTTVNRKTTGLFLLDTGASLSNIDSTFARLSTKVSGDYHMHVKGVSGDVGQVFQADSAELQFAQFRQSNLGLVAFNLNNSPDHQEVRTAGILGYPILSMFRLTLDYRNGRVKFDYTHK